MRHGESMMQKTYLFGGSISLLAAAILVGCNSNDDDNAALKQVPSTAQVTITPSLGKILNAKVVLKNAKTGATLGSGTTGNTGIATFDASKTTDPVIVEVQGVDGAQGATYFDEAKNADIALPASQKIRAIAPNFNANTNIGVTVLTELATQSAEKALGGTLTGITTTVVNQANDQIKNLLAKELGSASLLTPPTLIGKTTIIKDAITANNAANSYALKLAGLAKMGAGNTPVLDVLQKLSDDISDNKLDGKKGSVEIDYQTGSTEDITDALQAYISAYANAAQINTIYTAQILNGFQVLEGNITITLTSGGTGGGTGGSNGSVCAASANYNLVVQGFPVNQSVKYCYINFPANTVCGVGNSVLSGYANNINVPGVSGNISWSYTSAATCPSDAVLTYDYATNQVIMK